MRAPWLSLGPVLLAALAPACGGSGSSNETASGSSHAASTSAASGTGGGGGTGGATSGTGGNGGQGGQGGTPIASPYGLDARPANPTCKAPARPASPSPVAFTKVFSGFDTPMGITQIPGDPSRFFVFQRGGTVVSFPASDPTTKTTVLTVPQPVDTDGEGGLLGMAFHPKFATNGYVYFSYTTTGGSTGMRSVVARMKSTDGGKTFGGYKELLGPFEQPYTNHKGGDVHFGNDGFLYLSFGDGGSGGDPLKHGQNTSLFFSKILRIDVDGGDPYAIPAGNPFKAGGGEPATFAYGFRNPFRFSVDRGTGELWVGDVGQDAWEEIDAKIVAGGNYGWNTREGKHCYSPMNGCATAGFVDPIYEYDHTVGHAVIGGVVYRGKLLPSFVGTYLFADEVNQGVWSLAVDPSSGAASATSIKGSLSGSWVGFGEDNDGEAYLVDLGGTIYKLGAAGATPPTDPFPDALSKTGCFDASDVTKPAAGLIPYAPHSQLWSDGASKERWLALPDGKQITVGADGDFDIPIGSVLVKSFRVAGKLVETRLLVHHDDGGWAGYTYEWNDAQTDATLLASSKTKAVGGGQDWYYPSRDECLSCHSTAAGRTLGLEIGQLNADLVYPATNRVSNQLATFDHIGLFDAPLPGPVDSLARYPDPKSAEGTAETRARSYVHANCSFCHRPGGNGNSAMDLRYATAANMTGTCNASPNAGDLGIAGAKIVAPGDPAHSLLSVRPKTLGAGRMPPLASHVVDGSGTATIDAWITGLTSCP